MNDASPKYYYEDPIFTASDIPRTACPEQGTDGPLPLGHGVVPGSTLWYEVGWVPDTGGYDRPASLDYFSLAMAASDLPELVDPGFSTAGNTGCTATPDFDESYWVSGMDSMFPGASSPIKSPRGPDEGLIMPEDGNNDHTSKGAINKGNAGSKHKRSRTTRSNLRTAVRRKVMSDSHREPSPDDEDDEAAQGRRARQNHNCVEKRYRERLNQQFDQLLLTMQECKGGLAELQNARGETRRWSKADVLEIARRQIHALRQEQGNLRAELSALADNIQLMEGPEGSGWPPGADGPAFS